VAYDADLALVRRVLLTIGLSEPRALPEPPVEVVFVEMGDNGVRVSLRLFAREADYWSVLSDLRSRVKSALDEAGIGFAETKYVLSGNEMQPKKDPV
jgi:small conductance mechanosensitive channel